MVEREEKFKVFGKQRATTLIKTRLLKRLIRDERFPPKLTKNVRDEISRANVSLRFLFKKLFLRRNANEHKAVCSR